MTKNEINMVAAAYVLASKAARVVEAWDTGDLAGAVRDLNHARRETVAALKPFMCHECLRKPASSDGLCLDCMGR